MDLKDNFEDDNELSGLEEDDELGAKKGGRKKGKRR